MKLLSGIVVSGKGNFSQWIKKLHDYYYQKTGLNFFPGTLNIKLNQPYRIPENSLCLNASEYGGTVSIYLVPCQILDHAAYILRTDRNEQGIGDHPLNIVEIACEIKLRDAHQLQDGDRVEIQIFT
jgi:riboflavin kinase, archaea type